MRITWTLGSTVQDGDIMTKNNHLLSKWDVNFCDILIIATITTIKMISS